MARWRDRRRERKALRNQKTFVYCPVCRFELVAGGEWLGQDTTTFHEAYRCNRCGAFSTWDFDFPAPVVVSHSVVTAEQVPAHSDQGPTP